MTRRRKNFDGVIVHQRPDRDAALRAVADAALPRFDEETLELSHSNPKALATALGRDVAELSRRLEPVAVDVNALREACHQLTQTLREERTAREHAEFERQRNRPWVRFKRWWSNLFVFEE